MTADSIVLDKNVFKEGLKKLEAAFRAQPMPKDSIKIYYEKLKGAPDDIFQRAIDNVIERENFFPSISVLIRETALRKTPEWY